MMASETVPLMKGDKLDSLYDSDASLKIFDTRTREEFEISRLPGAVWIGDGDTIPPHNPDDSVPVVVYCSIGYRSGLAGERLLDSGYSEVYNLEGGIFHWVNAGKKLMNSHGAPTDTIHGYSPLWGSWINQGVVVYE
ncbi:rhodanese-like domain-containing protein [Roseivirga sp. BDSF3-8]|uniref:rhodanese-like domain-containing protein n=1 Tax=Roseivirga sp. BDSF3-8 TaxID=3241598 RepID=UPI0035323E23